jgi:hypothetical protein
MTDVIRPAFQSVPEVRCMINVGAGMDIPTGNYLPGIHGESILNGGLGMITGIVAFGNMFKTTMMRHMSLTAMARACLDVMNTYDTEVNTHLDRLRELALNIEEFGGEDIIHEGKWVVTDKTIHTGDEWFDILKDYLILKKKNADKMSIVTPFLDTKTNQLQKIVKPSITEVDSLSEFITSDVVKMQDENSLGESGANTMAMRQGLQKSRFLMEIPGLAGGAMNYTLLTAHVGETINMNPMAPVTKQLTFLKQGFKIKGVPAKFTFVTNNCWFALKASVLVNQNTKAPEFPRDSEDNNAGDTDLFCVSICQLRGKSGPTGIILDIVVSQEDGVLPSLTEFYLIKEHDRYGLEGNDRNYNLALLPDVKLSRTVVRGKIDENALLRRALNITSEMCQMKLYWRNVPEHLKCTPKELYDDLKALGYDWDMILSETRGWWAPVGCHEELKFLSTMDLMKMRAGEYIPYWMENPPEAAIALFKSKQQGK